MADLSELGTLGSVLSNPEDGPAPGKGQQPLMALRVLRLAPIPRGVVAPVVGRKPDPAVVRALMMSGDGWLNKDGRVVANGTCRSREALGAVPEIAAAFARIAELDAASLERARSASMAARARHRVSGETADDFHFDANLLDDYCPEEETANVIAEAGWTEIALRRNDGTKRVLCAASGPDAHAFREHVEDLEETLGFASKPRPGRNRMFSQEIVEIDDDTVPTFGR
jgi:hypothetical protein